MNIRLDSFVIANGDDRTLQVCGSETVTLQQETPGTVRSRATVPTFFTTRAVRSVPLSYTVTWPPCDSLAEAFAQSRAVPAACPNGGVLVEEHDGARTTYAAAKVESITAERIGVTNRFTFNLAATSPAAHSMVLDELGDVLLDEGGNELEY